MAKISDILVILTRRRYDPFFDSDFQADFPLRTTRWAEKLEITYGGLSRLVRTDQVSKRELQRADQGFGGIGDFGVEDVEREGGLAEGASYGESEALVPEGASGARVVRPSGKSIVRVEVENDVGFEITVSPVYVFEVFSGDYCDVEIQRAWGGHETRVQCS